MLRGDRCVASDREAAGAKYIEFGEVTNQLAMVVRLLLAPDVGLPGRSVAV